MTSGSRRDRVSVALCTYNGARFIAEQLDSLLTQTHTPYELIAADDASSDNTWQILQHYAPRFERVRLIRNTKNLGLRANFQQVFEACSGDWIAPCDQDDIWEPDKIAALLQAAGNEHGLAYGDSALIDEAGRSLNARISDHFTMISGSRPRSFVFRNCVSGHACIFDRKLLERALPLPEEIYYDWWLSFIASSFGSICYVDRSLVRCRRHAATITALGKARKRVRRSPLERYHSRLTALQALAAVPGPDQAFFSDLLRHWVDCENRWVSNAWAVAVNENWHELHAIDRRNKQNHGPHTWRRLMCRLKESNGLRLP